MKYDFKPLGALSTDILDAFYQSVEDKLYQTGCENGGPGGCGSMECWCADAMSLARREEISADAIGVLLCEAGISVLINLSPSMLHSMYLEDIAFSEHLNEWSASLNETARLDEKMSKMPPYTDEHDSLALRASEVSMRRIDLAEKIAGRSIAFVSEEDSGEKPLLVATDIFLHARWHPFYADLLRTRKCAATTVSETDITCYLYSEASMSPRQVWEIWKHIFVDTVSEFYPLSTDALRTARELGAKLGRTQ